MIKAEKKIRAVAKTNWVWRKKYLKKVRSAFNYAAGVLVWESRRKFKRLQNRGLRLSSPRETLRAEASVNIMKCTICQNIAKLKETHVDRVCRSRLKRRGGKSEETRCKELGKHHRTPLTTNWTQLKSPKRDGPFISVVTLTQHLVSYLIQIQVLWPSGETQLRLRS